MAKSNYPNKLDTSVEIPVIRDNITEIGSDVLNSLRSAIFNIERTLGINPQGAAGNTVASRLNSVVDDNGNILKESLDKAGLLSGPIANNDVSKSAGIDESKLNLNFPTNLLQTQVSTLDQRLGLFIKSLEELNTIIATHIHPEAKNRHFAKAIRVESTVSSTSSLSTRSISEGTLQEALEELYSSHINYTGEGVGPENNSHSAGQIYYDNEKTSDIISSDNVQGAIDSVASDQADLYRSAFLNFSSNGIIRTGKVTDPNEQLESSSTLISDVQISYSEPNGSSRQIVALSGLPVPMEPISSFDVLILSNAAAETDDGEYLIDTVKTDPATGGVESVTIFGGPKNPDQTGAIARIIKSPYTNYNENGLNCSARPRFLRSNTPDIQFANPNSATIISSGIRISNVIEGLSDTLAVEIDGSTHEIPVYNSDLNSQTIDSVVDKINQYVVENKLNIFSYKMRSLNCYEIAISHILPNLASDTINRTIAIKEASSNSAHSVLGFLYILDRTVEGSGNNSCHINGRILNSFGNIRKYTNESLGINPGTGNLVAAGSDFLADGIRVGDLCTIQGSSESLDDGTYRVNSVDSDTVILDVTGDPLTGELVDGAAIFFQRCSAPVGELEFKELDGTTIIDVFLTEEGDINYSRRADIVGHIQDIGFYAIVTDFSKNFITDDDEYTLTVEPSGNAYLTNSAGQPGPEAFVGTTGRHKVFSVDKMRYLVLDVLADQTGPALADTIEIFGASDIPDSVLHLCRLSYSTEFGFILGSPSDSGGGIPRVIDKRSTGTSDDTIVGEALLERYIQGPRNDLRGNGIIRDILIKDITYNPGESSLYMSVEAGVAVVSGVRFEYLGIDNLFVNYSEEGVDKNFYVALNGEGCLLVGNETTVHGKNASPFHGNDVAHIAYIDVLNQTITDLRLFVDNIDYKIIADITVSNDQRFSHFTDIQSAVDYARLFSRQFPDLGRPSIVVKEGEYKVKSTVFLDFDVTISGAGPQTIITRDLGTLDGEAVGGGFLSVVFAIGSGTLSEEGSSEDIHYGVTLKDFTYATPENMSDFGLTIALFQSLDTSPRAKFLFKDISFINLDKTSRHEWAISVGPYFEDGVEVGNVLINNCYFDFMGNGDGPVNIASGESDANTINGVVINGCIAKNVSGGYGAPVLTGSGIGRFSGSANVTGFIESGNYSDGQ